MKLFRIQNDDGQGPFRAEKEPAGGMRDIEKFYSQDWHPLPIDDFSNLFSSDIPKHMQYACDSIDNLKKWFVLTDEMLKRATCPLDEGSTMTGFNAMMMRRLSDAGFYLVEIDIADEFCDYGESQTQVCYDTRKIINLTIHPIESLYRGHL